MKSVALAVLCLAIFAAIFVLGWQANQRIAILTVDEYGDLLKAQLHLQMIMADPARICGKPSGFM